MSDIKAYEYYRRAIKNQKDDIKSLENKRDVLMRQYLRTQREIEKAKMDLVNYPKNLFFSTRWLGKVPMEVINLIMWYYVRMSDNTFKTITRLPRSLQPLLDPITLKVLNISSFCDMIQSHKMGTLLNQCLYWSTAGSEKARTWKTVPIKGHTLKDVLQQVPTLNFRAGSLKATVFGPDGIIVFKCPHSHEVSRLLGKRLTLFERSRSIQVLNDGFMIPYQITDITRKFIFQARQGGVAKLNVSFIVNTKSWRLQEIYTE